MLTAYLKESIGLKKRKPRHSTVCTNFNVLHGPAFLKYNLIHVRSIETGAHALGSVQDGIGAPNLQIVPSYSSLQLLCLKAAELKAIERAELKAIESRSRKAMKSNYKLKKNSISYNNFQQP